MRVACAIALCAALSMPACGTNATGQEEYMPGQPLDAIKMSAPTFADQNYPTYKVVDRTSGACWWLVRIGGDWVALPVCMSKSYEQQQEVE